MSNNTGHEYNLQKRYGAIPGYLLIGFMGWMLKIFIGILRNHDNINIILEILLVLSAFCSFAYICKIIYLHCEEKKLGIFGSNSRVFGIVISLAVFLVLNIFIRI